MKWTQTLPFFQTKRTKTFVGGRELDNQGDLPADALAPSDGVTLSTRRAVSKEQGGEIQVADREARKSLEIWQEARRARNSTEDRTPRARTTDTLTVCKAGDTTLVNNTYVVIKHLGSGAFGRVKLCLNIRDHKLYAVKACRKSQIAQSLRHLGRRNRRNCQWSTSQNRQPRRSLDGMNAFGGSNSSSKRFQAQEAFMRLDEQTPYRTEELVREIAVLKRLKHPNIVSLVEVIDDPRTDSLLLVMEYVEGGTLEPKQIGPKQWEPVPEVDVWRYVREILQGLDYLHFHKVVHGDLKPANLLWDSNASTVKIVDFSCSVTADSMEMIGTISTTPAFRSPESLVAGYRLNEETDMWALGVCVYMWIYGQLPFNGDTPYAIYEKIRLEPLQLPRFPLVTDGVKDLIMRLLDKQASSRMGTRDALEHIWVTQAGLAPLTSLHGCSIHATWRNGFEPSPEEIDEAMRETFNGSKLVENVLREVTFSPGTDIVCAGEPVNRVFLIAHGQVELQEADGQTGPYISGMGPLADGLDPDLLEVPLQDGLQSEALLQLMTDCGGVVHREPRLFSDGCGSFAVLGPGESLGLTSMHHHACKHVWKANVRAKTEVLAFVAEVDDLLRLMKEHPETESAVKQIAVQQETDMMVAEALRQLRLSAMSRLPLCTMAG